MVPQHTPAQGRRPCERPAGLGPRSPHAHTQPTADGGRARVRQRESRSSEFKLKLKGLVQPLTP